MKVGPNASAHVAPGAESGPELPELEDPVVQPPPEEHFWPAGQYSIAPHQQTKTLQDPPPPSPQGHSNLLPFVQHVSPAAGL
jgi:hypothetical protein